MGLNIQLRGNEGYCGGYANFGKYGNLGATIYGKYGSVTWLGDPKNFIYNGGRGAGAGGASGDGLGYGSGYGVGYEDGEGYAGGNYGNGNPFGGGWGRGEYGHNYTRNDGGGFDRGEEIINKYFPSFINSKIQPYINHQ